MKVEWYSCHAMTIHFTNNFSTNIGSAVFEKDFMVPAWFESRHQPGNVYLIVSVFCSEWIGCPNNLISFCTCLNLSFLIILLLISVCLIERCWTCTTLFLFLVIQLHHPVCPWWSSRRLKWPHCSGGTNHCGVLYNGGEVCALVLRRFCSS